MAWKKGNQHKKCVVNTVSDFPDNQKRGNASDTKVLHEEELLENDSGVPSTESSDNKHQVEAQTKRKHKFRKSSGTVEEVLDRKQDEERKETDAGECDINISAAENSYSTEKEEMPPNHDSESSFYHSLNGLLSGDDVKEHVKISYSFSLLCRHLRRLGSTTLQASSEWLEKHKPLFITTRLSVVKACYYVQEKFEVAYPTILKWIMHIVNISLLLFMVWLDCTLRGIESFLRMGTPSFFSVVWCSLLSVTAVIGVFKLLLFLVGTGIVGLFMGFTIAAIVMAISGIILLWCYGSFWTGVLLVFSAGFAFTLGRERLALFIATSYSVYCAWTYVGLLGLLFGLNLSFISSDVLIFFLRNKMNETRRPNGTAEQTANMSGASDFSSSGQVPNPSTETATPGSSIDQRSGNPSTSGSDSDTTSEDEVIRLLNCVDHYAALGLSRFVSIDVSVLRREYRKKVGE